MPRPTLALLALAFLGAAGRSGPPAPGHTARERVVVNDNRVAAGTLRGGVLTVRLEAREGEWHPDGDADPGLVVRAFGEAGRPLRIPGPLLRVAEGTEIHAFVRNALADSTLTIHGLSTRGTTVATAADTIQIRPGVTREVRFVAGAPGTYYYWGSTAPGGMDERSASDAELSGAFVVDPSLRSGQVPRALSGIERDRIFVINLWTRSTGPAGVIQRGDVLRFTINGKAWPNTERLAYALGDSVRFRVVNASVAPHPMHLHGFYFDVRSRGDGTRDSTYGPDAPHRVVTERIAPGRTATLTWVPERAGYWLFHCHDNFHALRNRPLDGTPLPAEHLAHVENHALGMMGGLVMGIEVRNLAARLAMTERDLPVGRRLRLVARVDPSAGGTVDEPAYGYVLQDGATTTPDGGPLLPGPTILLRRGEPVSITVVNELPEATAVHWHGMELDSYYDGVAGFAGHPGRIAPLIAPRDSFEVRFTPPRSGTFMYHPHADEVRQQQAGLTGALLVVDDPAAYDREHDVVLLLSVPRRDADRDMIYLNGTTAPPVRELRVGERYRLRLVDVHTFRPSMIARLERDSTLLTWRAVAKDGMTLPADQATMRRSVQQMGNGETYDFEFVPAAAGELRLRVTTGVGVPLVTMPIRVR